MADSKLYGHTDTAAADGGVVNTNDDGERVAHDDGQGEGVNPIVVNPDQPTFPRPFGVSDDDLREQGVGHGYQGVGSDEQVKTADEDRAFVDVGEEEGARPAIEPEGKPADPDAEAKAAAAAEVAEKAKAKQGGKQGSQGDQAQQTQQNQ